MQDTTRRDLPIRGKGPSMGSHSAQRISTQIISCFSCLLCLLGLPFRFLKRAPFLILFCLNFVICFLSLFEILCQHMQTLLSCVFLCIFFVLCRLALEFGLSGRQRINLQSGCKITAVFLHLVHALFLRDFAAQEPSQGPIEFVLGIISALLTLNLLEVLLQNSSA